METQLRRSANPIYIGAAVAVIVFCAAGVGAIMGWIPTSLGGVAPTRTAEIPAPVPAPAKQDVAAVKHKPARVTKVAAPVAAAPAPVATAKNKCGECGVIESIREVDKKGAGTGLGAVGGAVAGGILGNQLGAGRGKDVMMVVGAVGGAVAGNEVEKRVKSTKSYEITVRFEDGSTRVLTEAKSPTWRPGDKVKVIDGSIHPNNA